MNFPAELRYTKEHEWLRLENGLATIGITHFAQSELGDIVFVEVNNNGELLNKNEIFGTIEAVKTVSDLYLPVSGTIIEINPLLQSTPELVNTDPYGQGWIIRLKVDNEEEVHELLTAVDYSKLVS
jgi:glycine cleavage system H protein